MAKNAALPRGFLFSHPAHFIACGCGSGLSPVAPGTAGTLFAWATFPLFSLLPNAATAYALLVLAFVVGIYVCQRAGRDLGVADHGAIVWDEIVPFWTVLFCLPDGFAMQALAFAAFRFFDIVKPFPASWFDRHAKNGFGVMMDDVAAAGYTIFIMLLGQQLWRAS